MTIKTMQRFLLIALSLLSAFNLTAQDKNEKLHRLFDNYYEEYKRLSPLDATAAGDNRYNDLLPNDISAPYINEQERFFTRYQDSLRPFNREELNTADRISFDVLTEVLRHQLQLLKYHLEYIPFGQLSDMPLTIGQLGAGESFLPFNTAQDYRNWNKRMIAFGPWLDTAIANLEKGKQMGMMRPKVIVEKAITAMTPLTETDPAKSMFYRRLTNMPASISKADKKRIIADYKKTISTILAPAYKRLVTYLKDVYLPAAPITAGVNVYPLGKEYYEEQVHFYTTASYTPEDVYQLGLSEVARITQEMEGIKTKTGFTGTLQEFFHFLKTDKQFMPFKTPEEVIAAYSNIYQKIQPHLPEMFSLQPKSKFEIRRSLPFMEHSQGGPSYLTPSIDGARPGIFYVPIPDATKVNVTFYGLEATFIHEAIPGHHFQIALQQENTALPAFRKLPTFSSYVEGWALYCESLGEQVGCYTDPYQKMGALNNEIHRAIRLVVDVALHTGKMTREEAIAYMTAHESVDNDIATKEIDRYIANPGQALSYKAGGLTIMRLREKYSKLLGDKFSLLKFHDAVLRQGDMPLTVFEKYMDDWAASVK
ncbi:DUF885 family protein [Chitinophaga sp. S165]|uniref:DUF885 domain-containing protein n=1 Tax=Chitinophaga sp. S165 TaxID=2135462 RepID=UPI000D71052B|nr:DUF885 domain-containing protein [Chitinophaga sp. S165]PWV51424.1 uncharacterized protein (DUF885 family) [Chitinophaga sp. S165]